jgi:hypothetical protein
MRLPRMPRLMEPRHLRPAEPTIDHYLAGPLADRIRLSPEPAAALGALRPDLITRIGANTFATASAVVVVRYVTDRELEIIRSRPWAGIYYLIDDVLPVAGDCLELPSDYRRRLARFAATLLPRLLALEPVIVAPNPAILALFPNHVGERLDPAWLSPPGPPTAMDWRLDGGGLRLAFLGTRSHQASLPHLAATMDLLRDRLPGARLTLFHGRQIPPRLARHPMVESREPVAWEAFHRTLRAACFHIGLGFLTPTPFNRGRSISKVLDHGSAGVAGLYSARPPFEGAVVDGENGLLLGDDAGAWADAVLALAADPARAARLAAGGRFLASRLGDPERVRRFWLARLGMAEIAPPATGHAK